MESLFTDRPRAGAAQQRDKFIMARNRALLYLGNDDRLSVTVINWSKPWTRGNDGKTLVSVDLSEIQHTPMAALPARNRQSVICATRFGKQHPQR
jgi:hypothetical protein